MKKQMPQSVISGNVILLLLTVIQQVNGQCPLPQPCDCYTSNGETIIDCANHGLTAIPNITSSAALYGELRLESNQITSLPPNAFQGLRIKRLNFGELRSESDSSNQINSVSPDAFKGLEADLIELSLIGDKVNGFATPYTAMHILVNLEKLTLSYFSQTSLTDVNFSPFHKLTFLKLDHMQINLIPGQTFAQNTQLQTLQITNSKLTSLPLNALRQLTNVQYLSFATAEIKVLSAQAFQVMTNLKTLDVSYNGIATIEADTFTGVEDSLTNLNLRSNSLNNEQIKNIGNMSLLQELILSYNQLNSMPTNYFPKLNFLNVDHNHINTIQDSASYGSLHELRLSENRILQTGTNDFLKFPSLKKLYMKQQQGATLAIQSFSGLENSLEFLDLSQNSGNSNPQIDQQATWAAIKMLSKLKTLIFNHANIQSIPEFEFSNMPSLETISLLSNDLAITNQEMFHGLRDSLKSIDFDDNSIRTIDRCVFKDFTKLDNIQLNNNPLHCNCLLEWLFQWYRDKEFEHPDIMFIYNWACNSPENVKGPFAGLDEADVRVCTDNVTQPVCKDYYTTTTPTTTTIPTTTTTTPTTTPIPLPTITGREITLSDTYIIVQWTVSDDTYVSGFTITSQQEPHGTISTIDISSPQKSEQKVSNLLENKEYKFCIIVKITHSISEPNPQVCFSARTVIIPTITLGIISKDPNAFEIVWTATDSKHIASFSIEVTNTLNNDKEQTISNIPDIVQKRVLTNLKPNTNYEVCVTANLIDNIQSPPVSACSPARTTASQATTSGQGGNDDQEESWVIIVAIVAAVVFVLLLVLIIFLLFRYKRMNKREKTLLNSSPGHVQPHSFTSMNAPRPAYDSKRFARPKKTKQDDDITVKVISTGKMDGTRMSAGSYQFLDESQPNARQPMPSTSSNYTSNYVNSQGVRPLPHKPQERDGPPNYYDTINDGVDNSAFESSPTGSPINSPGLVNDAFEASPSKSQVDAPPRTSSRPESDNFETPI